MHCCDMIKEELGKQKFLRKIVLLLKRLLALHSLNIPYQGGLSSYGLFLMCASYLNATEHKFCSIGHCFMNLLQFYGTQFDPVTTGICYDGYSITYFPVLREAHTDSATNCKKAGIITPKIIDPLNNQNNITNNAYRFRDIQECFSSAYAQLLAGKEAEVYAQSQATVPAAYGMGILPSPNLLPAIYNE